MTQKQSIQLFNEKQVRTVWDDATEEYYFSVMDVVAILTESANPTDYIKKLRVRDEELAKGWGQIVTPLPIRTKGGTQKVNCANKEGIFRIIQSIPSPNAEPFKLWMAKVASERIDEMIDPELAIDRAYDYYRRKGYSEGWINQRMKGKEARKALTDEWKRTGVKDQEYATLTDIITQEWSGMKTKAYKRFKNLKKENLRDNMTNVENALNTLAEVATTELSKKYNPKNLGQNMQIAKGGGNVAKIAREKLEQQLGESVITRDNARTITQGEQKKLKE